MRLAHAFLAEAAQVQPDGKFSVLGGDFDMVWVTEVPTIFPVMAVVMKVWMSSEEADRPYTLRLQFVAPDGSQVAEANMDLPPQQLSAPEKRRKVSLVAQFMQVPFAACGEYAVRLFIGDEELAKLPLRVELKHQEVAPQ